MFLRMTTTLNERGRMHPMCTLTCIKYNARLLLQSVRGIFLPTFLLQNICFLQHFLFQRFGILLHFYSEPRDRCAEDSDSQ